MNERAKQSRKKATKPDISYPSLASNIPRLPMPSYNSGFDSVTSPPETIQRDTFQEQEDRENIDLNRDLPLGDFNILANTSIRRPQPTIQRQEVEEEKEDIEQGEIVQTKLNNSESVGKPEEPSPLQKAFQPQGNLGNTDIQLPDSPLGNINYLENISIHRPKETVQRQENRISQASKSILQRQSPPETTTPAQETSENQTETSETNQPLSVVDPDTPWDETGNLIGNPPVRDRKEPPNKNIVEDETVYKTRLNTAKTVLENQKTRAEGLVDTNSLGQECIRDYRYWFAKVYSHVTENEIAFAQNSTYYYPSYVMASVLYFDKIYEDNFNAFDEGGKVEEHWMAAFQEARNRQDATWQQTLMTLGGALGGGAVGGKVGSIPGAVGGAIVGGIGGWAAGRLNDVVVSLTAAMKAHIRYDLPRSEAWVFNKYYSHFPNAKLRDFQPDFMSMSGVFDNAALAMNDDMAQKLGIPESVMVKIMPQLVQDASMRIYFDADMATERADTWQRAEELVSDGHAGTDPYSFENGQLTGDVTDSDNMSGLQNLSPDLRPEMENAAVVYDDNAVRGMSREQIEATSTTQRIRMLRGLFNGFTGDDDENRIQMILDVSKNIGDVVTVIDGADPWDLAYATDWSDYEKLRQFFMDNYYGRTSQDNALRIIRKCLDGETAEWEEQMVIDILEKHSNAYSIIEEIGRIYQSDGPATGSDADFKNGLYKLEWQLDGQEETRLEEMFGSSGQGFWNF